MVGWVGDVVRPWPVVSSPKPLAWITSLSCFRPLVQYKQGPVEVLWCGNTQESCWVRTLQLQNLVLCFNTGGHMTTTENSTVTMHHMCREETAVQTRVLFLHCCNCSFKSVRIICCFVGIVSSNTRDLAAKVTYPHLNFSIPVTVFQRLLQHFHQTSDVNVFRVLDTTDQEVSTVWRLQGAQSKL